jgi:cell division protein FtsB
LDGGKYAKIYSQLIDLQNINYEQSNESLKIKLEIEKSDIAMKKLSEQNKELNEENNKLKEDVLFYEKMLGKRKK